MKKKHPVCQTWNEKQCKYVTIKIMEICEDMKYSCLSEIHVMYYGEFLTGNSTNKKERENQWKIQRQQLQILVPAKPTWLAQLLISSLSLLQPLSLMTEIYPALYIILNRLLSIWNRIFMQKNIVKCVEYFLISYHFSNFMSCSHK